MSNKRIFWLLFIINLFNYIDRQTLFAVFPLIKTEMALTDAQLGSLASMFMIVYMIYAPIAGYFADRTPRQYWMGASAVLWSFATSATGYASSFMHLVGARSAIGVGEAGFTTVAQGYLAEHYPQQKRARILAAFGLALPLGSALGYLAGGFFGHHFGWRAAFMLVGVPGFFLGLLAMFKIKDERNFKDGSAEKPKLSGYIELLMNKPFIFICLAQAAGVFVVGALMVWMPTYFNRYLGFSVVKASSVFGMMIIGGGAIGTFLGGQIADRLLAGNKYAYMITAGVSFFMVPPFAVAGVVSTNVTFSLVMFFIAITLATIQTGPLAAAIVETTPSKMRSMAFALNIFIIHALGDAISPTIIGKFSDIWDLRTAILLCLIMLLPACLFCVLAGRAKK
ncbi:MFS family permease [Elusimicrobium posterum]|uniref:spinster family MFS transporter n=1 Tax=Elusimicrobium posterum TaxID=3116653 RepID=UPI003C79035F